LSGSERLGLGSEPRPEVSKVRGGRTRGGWRARVAAAVLLIPLGALLYGLGTFVDVWLASRARYEAIEAISPRDESVPMQRAAVVLGAAQYNGEPSPVLRARLDEAGRLYEAGQVDLVVVTGGRQEADITTEAKTGYDYLRETTGIPDERLRLEVHGSSTYESLAATARFLSRESVVDVVLVTDRFHARRAELTAQEVGLEPALALTSQAPSLDRLIEETGAVAVGRLISFRRLDRL
jgi:vancomycin permeability regulator SanA